MPGFGAAPAGPVRSIDGWARMIDAAADALGLERFILLAHSFGGGAALLAAGRLPNRLSGLVLIASMGIRRHRALTGPPWVWRAFASLVAFPPSRHLAIGAARRGYRSRRLPFPSNWRDLYRHLRLTGSINFGAIRRATAAITAPAIVFQAQDDPLVEPDIAAGLAGTIPRATLHTFETGGHHLQKTRAREISTIISHELSLVQQLPVGHGGT